MHPNCVRDYKTVNLILKKMDDIERVYQMLIWLEYAGIVHPNNLGIQTLTLALANAIQFFETRGLAQERISLS